MFSSADSLHGFVRYYVRRSMNINSHFYRHILLHINKSSLVNEPDLHFSRLRIFPFLYLAMHLFCV